MTVKLLQDESSDAETAYRALVTLGNTVLNGKIRDPGFTSLLDEVLTKFPEERAKVLVAEIKGLMS